MGLSCECDFEPEAGQTIYYPPEDYSELKTTKRKRCCSCKELINTGSTVGAFERVKIADSQIEEAIYGDYGEVPRATWYMCEECTDIYFNLSALEFCVYIGQSMKALMKEYLDIYQPPKMENDNAR